MKRNLLLACAAILVIAMIIVPVMAAPSPANPLDQILSFVKDYKTKLDTILTKLTALQTDVTTIKTTTNTINTKLNAPPEPIRYEYYTAPMYLYVGGDPNTLITEAQIMNWGDTPAEVCVSDYKSLGPTDFQLIHSNCYTINAKNSKFSILETPAYNSKIYYSITTNSKFVAPGVILADGPGNIMIQYRPGDFQKVEIYS